MDHKMCLSVGNFEQSHWGFKSEINPNVNRMEWRIGSGTCDCDCGTCREVHGSESSKAFYIFRYTSTGRQVAKVEIIADGTEGIA